MFDQGNDAVLEVFTVLPQAEVQKRREKKLKKAKKKAKYVSGKSDAPPRETDLITHSQNKAYIYSLAE